ncbi:alpha/beta hydrolase [Rhodoferax sp.]|uniref:alpha/beta hydrolase n=1 Tax=Rhodoferax sp. TaxID=50421 RepID=UPI0019FA92C6|nr:alpha/beta hydrolase [Rhodoferax sp.]MBE0473571.1 alpha/beta hydrolase [Rhodoferax sp.]
MQPTSWTPDVLSGFEQTTLIGRTASDGPADAVLVRRRCNHADAKAVLYVHGFVDYFFQTHLADFYNQAGLHFYAIDLRRHGRAMRERQLPNFTHSIDDYLDDVDAAIHVLKTSERIDWLLLNGHSTGGLVTALYAHRGARRAAVNALFLNSPFLDMNRPPWQERFLEPMLAALGAWWPSLVIPVSTTVYGESLHADHHGEWRYNLLWKPIAGFPVYAGWFRAIHRAHAEVARGLSIGCPVLLMHAQRSSWPRQWSPEAMVTDVVLDVADMQRLAPGLGPQVKLVAIEDGMHDLVLSQAPVREKVFAELKAWLVAIS